MFHRLVHIQYVEHAQRLPKDTETGKFRVSSSRGEHDFDVVVNCLWEARRTIDKQVGIGEWSGKNMRLKLGIKTKPVPELLPYRSNTMVNGPFGDFVYWPHDDKMYFTWYPNSRLGMTSTDEIPPEWDQIASGNIPQDVAREMIDIHERKFNQLFPGVPSFKFVEPQVIGGFILGNGDKDVDDPDSELHKRADKPIVHEDGYFGVSTQKFTSGPLHAYMLERDFLMPEAKRTTKTSFE